MDAGTHAPACSLARSLDIHSAYLCLIQYVGVASFTILAWDHIITFSDEVTLPHHVHHCVRIVIDHGIIVQVVLIWKGPKGLRECSHLWHISDIERGCA